MRGTTYGSQNTEEERAFVARAVVPPPSRAARLRASAKKRVIARASAVLVGAAVAATCGYVALRDSTSDEIATVAEPLSLQASQLLESLAAQVGLRDVASFETLDVDGNGSVTKDEYVGYLANQRDQVLAKVAESNMADADKQPLEEIVRDNLDGEAACVARVFESNGDRAISKDAFETVHRQIVAFCEHDHSAAAGAGPVPVIGDTQPSGDNTPTLTPTGAPTIDGETPTPTSSGGPTIDGETPTPTSGGGTTIDGDLPTAAPGTLDDSSNAGDSDDTPSPTNVPLDDSNATQPPTTTDSPAIYDPDETPSPSNDVPTPDDIVPTTNEPGGDTTTDAPPGYDTTTAPPFSGGSQSDTPPIETPAPWDPSEPTRPPSDEPVPGNSSTPNDLTVPWDPSEPTRPPTDEPVPGGDDETQAPSSDTPVTNSPGGDITTDAPPGYDTTTAPPFSGGSQSDASRSDSSTSSDTPSVGDLTLPPTETPVAWDPSERPPADEPVPGGDDETQAPWSNTPVTNSPGVVVIPYTPPPTETASPLSPDVQKFIDELNPNSTTKSATRKQFEGVLLKQLEAQINRYKQQIEFAKVQIKKYAFMLQLVDECVARAGRRFELDPSFSNQRAIRWVKDECLAERPTPTQAPSN